MTSPTLFLIFIPILAIILLAVYLKFASKVSRFLKVNRYKIYITITCYIFVSLPIKSLLTSLEMEILIPVWAGLYACLLIIGAACANGKKLPDALIFVTAFSIAVIVACIFTLTLPQFISSLKELAFILPCLGLFSYYELGGAPTDRDISVHSMNPSEVNKTNSADEGSNNNNRKPKAKSPLSKKPNYEGYSSGSDYKNAKSKLSDAGVKFLDDGKIFMGNKDLSGDPNLLKIKKYSSPFDLTSQVIAASNNIPVHNLRVVLDLKQEMADLQEKIHTEIKELVKQQYRIGKSVKHSMGVPVLGGHVGESSSFDNAVKVNAEIAQENLDNIFVLAERKHQLSKAINFSPFFASVHNQGIFSKKDLKMLTDVSAFLAVHNDHHK